VIRRLPHATAPAEWYALPPTDYLSPLGVYADPHLAVLLVLLGFCLLYALVILVDAAVPGPEGGE
jgi:hypothetical protein